LDIFPAHRWKTAKYLAQKNQFKKQFYTLISPPNHPIHLNVLYLPVSLTLG